MPVPPMTAPEMFFGILVLTCFAMFSVTLAAVRLYVASAPRRRPAAPPATTRVVPTARGDHALSA